MRPASGSNQQAARQAAVLLPRGPRAEQLRSAIADAGFEVAVPTRVQAWAAGRATPAVVLTDDDGAPEVLDAGTRLAGLLRCVVLVREPTPARYRALLARCSAALPATAPAGTVVVAVEAAWRDLSCLPSSVAHALTGAPRADRPQLGSREVSWLCRLADGATVAGLARAAGYSEREMYRLLSVLYARLGASTRTEALLRADRWGLLAPPASVPVSGAGQRRPR